METEKQQVKPEGVGEWEEIKKVIPQIVRPYYAKDLIKDIENLLLQEKAKWKGEVKGKIEMLKYEEQEIEMAETGLSIIRESYNHALDQLLTLIDKL